MFINNLTCVCTRAAAIAAAQKSFEEVFLKALQAEETPLEEVINLIALLLEMRE